MSSLKNKLFISSLFLLSVNSFAKDPVIKGEQDVKDPVEIDGSISFKGEITDSSCDITQNDIEVDLGSHSVLLLENKDDMTPAEQFNIDITNCSLSMSSLKINMTGTAHKDNAALFALDADDRSAGNVGIVITNIAGTGNHPVNPAAGARDITLRNDSRNYTLTYSAAYQATGQATPGTGNATINYTVSYE
ncbi:type 1 fimbrial protein [Morganella morganii]